MRNRSRVRVRVRVRVVGKLHLLPLEQQLVPKLRVGVGDIGEI